MKAAANTSVHSTHTNGHTRDRIEEWVVHWTDGVTVQMVVREKLHVGNEGG